LVSRLSPRNRSTSRRGSARGGETPKARAADVLLLEELLAHLPVGMLVNDAETLEILHASPPLPGFPDEDAAELSPSDLASLVEQVAATGSPHHLPEFRRDVGGQGPRWWSASLHRIDTDSWGPVVVTLALDLTDQVRARDVLEERERRRLALRQAIAAVSGRNLVASLQQVADALVPALPVDVVALRLLDPDRKLHLIAAAGFRPAEIRRLALEPSDERRMEAMIEGRPHPLVGSLGLRWVEIRWLIDRDDRIGSLTVGARNDRRLTQDELALFDAATAQLAAGLQSVERDSRFLRRRSLEIARLNAEEDEARNASVKGLRPRELAILRLYGEGLGTHQIAELLVLSAHTVRTHVRNALRRLGVSSRHEALELLKGTDTDPVI
jgi:DNA-binding CsgD family transcriptional regulator